MPTTKARNIKVFGQSAFVVLFSLAVTHLAFAHAVVINSSPKDREILTQSPTEIMLQLNAKIEKALTRLSVISGDGKIMPLQVPKKESGSEMAPNRLVVPLPPLKPGNYILRYKVFSTDGHSTLGALRFTVTGKP